MARADALRSTRKSSEPSAVGAARTVLLACVLVAPLLLALGIAPSAEAAVTTSAARLPEPRYAASAAYVAPYVYVFGGFRDDGTASDRILRYDPAADRVDPVATVLPFPLANAAAAVSGGSVFLFGGNNEDGVQDSILRFDPSTPAVAVMQSRLPTPRFTTAVATSAGILLAGGKHVGQSTDYLDDLVVYDPVADALAYAERVLPTPLSAVAGAWDGANAVLVGGSRAPDGYYSPVVFAYNAGASAPPRTGELPPEYGPVTQAAAAAVGGAVFVAGGERLEAGGRMVTDRIARIDGGTAVTLLTQRLPVPTTAAAAASDGTTMFLVGGLDASDSVLDTVVRINAAGAPPGTTTATGAPTSVPGNRPPDARFHALTSVRVGQSVTFTDASVDPDGAADLLSWTWDFGDGGRSTQRNPAHGFPTVGTFTVALTVRDRSGASDTEYRDVRVLASQSGSDETGTGTRTATASTTSSGTAGGTTTSAGSGTDDDGVTTDDQGRPITRRPGRTTTNESPAASALLAVAAAAVLAAWLAARRR